MNELEKRAVHHRKRQKGLSPFCSLGESALSDITVYNGTNNADLDYSIIDLNNSREIGLHCGTEQACRDRGYKFINKLTVKSPKVLQLPFDVTSVWSSIELVRRLAQFELFDEKLLESLEKQMRKCADASDKYRKYSALLREFFLNKGYNVISYVNEIEDPGSTSYILLDMSIVHSDLEEGFNMRLDRKSIDKNRIDIAKLLRIPANSILIHENGRFEIHNISEDDARRYSNVLRNKVKDIRLIPGKYDFKKIPMPGQMPDRLVTISGMLKDGLTEEVLNEVKEFRDYKGYEMRADYDVDPEEGIMSLVVHLYKDGKEVQQDAYGRELSFENYRKAREWIDKHAKKCSLEDKLNQICAYIRQLLDYSEDDLHVTKDEYGYYILDRDYQGDNWHIYVKSNYAYDAVNCKYPGEWEHMSVEEFEKLIKEYPEYFDGIEYSIDDDSVSCELEYHEVQEDLYEPFIGSPFSLHQYEGCSLYDFVETVLQIYGVFIDKDNEFLVDEYDCSIPKSLTEAKKKKQKRFGVTLNPDAGNVEHNINMFNHMNSPTGGPSNNPVSGPFGGDVSAPSSDGCCESLKETKLKEAATKTVYRAEYYEPKLDKWVSYYENSDVEKVKSHKDDPIFGNPKIRVAQYTVSGVRKPSYKFVKLVESIEQKEKYYMAKYRGVNTDRLHKVYFRCDGDFEDAENLLDELIPEPYTSARVLGTVSKADAERDGFTKIGGTSGKELDDDFNMSMRTLL